MCVSFCKQGQKSNQFFFRVLSKYQGSSLARRSNIFLGKKKMSNAGNAPWTTVKVHYGISRYRPYQQLRRNPPNASAAAAAKNRVLCGSRRGHLQSASPLWQRWHVRSNRYSTDMIAKFCMLLGRNMYAFNDDDQCFASVTEFDANSDEFAGEIAATSTPKNNSGGPQYPHYSTGRHS